MRNKRLVIGTLLVVMLLTMVLEIAWAIKTEEGEKLTGKHYTLNIIGVPKDKKADMEESHRHTIFVPLDTQGIPDTKSVKIMLTQDTDEPYEFMFRFDKKRGKTEARKVFYRDGLELDDPLNEVGGGVIDIASFALRVAYILLSHPPKRRFIALDESFKCVRGEDNKRRTRKMLQLLAEKKGFQFLINTDIPEYRLGKIIEME